MRARTNISTKERRSFSISDFRGVDFSSSPMRVASGRAIDMTNWICENGVNQKRHGWRQLCEVLDGRINGIFPYLHDGVRALLVYAGTRFYKVVEKGGTYTAEEVTVQKGIALADRRIQAFWKKDGFFLVGTGGLYRYGADTKWQVKTVTPYVPTTTVNIDHTSVEDTERESMSPANFLTPWRKNTLVGLPEGTKLNTNGTVGFAWELDGALDIDTVMTIEITARDAIRTYYNGVYYEGRDGYTLGKNAIVSVEETELGVVYTQIGALAARENNLANLILYSDQIDTTPPIENTANITVTFCADIEDHSSKIMNCHFGTLFGIGGYDDRLFLSGNPDYPNTVFFSEADDFTYFPDTFTAVMGEGDGAITGFLRLGDDTLATFKAGQDGAARVYYQTGEYRTTYDEDGNVKKITPVFSIRAGATGECAVSPYTSVHLSGDNLMLSKNGVFAITPYENIATDMRVAQERSAAVRSRMIRQPSLSDAVGISHRGRYYLSMDGVCYVADSRYKYTDADSGAVQYEWWFWDHIPARVWSVVNDELWFGTEDGRICKFDAEYTDREFGISQDGDFTMNADTDRVTYNSESYAPQENDLYEIQTAGAYALYARIRLENGVATPVCVDENGKEAVDTERIADIIEGDTVHLADENGNVSVFALTIAEVDRRSCTFSLVGKGVEGVSGTFLLGYPISGKRMYVTDVKENTFALKETWDSPAMDIIALPSNPIIWFYNSANVVARWCTPYFNMGTDISAKTLLSLTLSALPEMGGALYFGYETAKTVQQLRLRGTGVFSFENLDFYDFSFDTGFQNSHTVRVKERNFNYILFRMVSDSDGPCSINALTAVYKINKRNLGVM